jgi:hypothetical protein
MIRDKKKGGRARSAHKRDQKIFARKYEIKRLLGDCGVRGGIKLNCIISHND